MLRVTSILLVMLSSAHAHAQWSAFSGLGVAQYESDLRRECNAGRRSSCDNLRELLRDQREAEDERRHKKMMRALRDVRDYRR